MAHGQYRRQRRLGTAGGASQQPGEKEEGKAARQQKEADTVRQTDLVEVTLQSTEADKVQRRLALLENHVAGTAVALGPEDDVLRSRHAAHPANRLRSLRGKGLGRDLNQVNVLHDYVGHPSIVVEEVVDMRHAWSACIALGEVGQVVQRHDLGVEGRVRAELDKVFAEWEAATIVAVVLILALVLGAGTHDGWLEGRKVRGRRHQWEVTRVDGAIRREGHGKDASRRTETSV